jgi:hypothetical protein
VFFVTGLLAVSPAAQDTRVSQVLAAARQALGGDAALGAVRSFNISGRLTRDIGDQEITLQVEIDCELPDKFVRRTTNRNPLLSTSSFDGFNGDEPIRYTIPPMRQPPLLLAGPGAPDKVAESRKRLTMANKRTFVRLTLAMFAASFDAYPLTLTYAGQEIEQDRMFDVVEIKGPDDVMMRLSVDAVTHLPRAVRWQTEPIVIRVQTRDGPGWPANVKPPPGVILLSEASSGDPAAGLPLVEHRLLFTEYKKTDGLNWPHRLQEIVNGAIAEDARFSRFKINPKIDPKKFAAAK